MIITSLVFSDCSLTPNVCGYSVKNSFNQEAFIRIVIVWMKLGCARRSLLFRCDVDKQFEIQQSLNSDLPDKLEASGIASTSTGFDVRPTWFKF